MVKEKTSEKHCDFCVDVTIKHYHRTGNLKSVTQANIFLRTTKRSSAER